MGRVVWSLVAGLVAAVVLTGIRGGFADAPIVVPIFGAAGFALAYGVGWLSSPDRGPWVAGGAADRPRVALLRDLLAAGAAVSCLAWSGPAILGAMYAGWLVALFLGAIVPLALALLCARLAVAWGLLAVTCITVSLLAHQRDFRADLFDADAWARVWERDVGVWAMTWAILAGLSLMTTVPIALARRRGAGRRA